MSFPFVRVSSTASASQTGYFSLHSRGLNTCVSALIGGLWMSVPLTVIAESVDQSRSNLEQMTVVGFPYKPSARTGDAAQLLRDQGVDFFSAGGVSSLPVLRGLNDDRVKLLLDGVESTSSCANHMNPALSYMDASQVSSVEVMAGITPVSLGGDSIAGTIVLDSEPPIFAASPNELLTKGSVAYFYRSNNRNHGVALSGQVADDQFSLSYSGALDKAESYRDGNGDKVLDTLYRSENHSVTLGVQGGASDSLLGENQSLTLKLSHQEIPYQGFPNQYMDMVGNVSNALNLQHVWGLNWGTLNTQLSWQDVSHEMGFFTAEKPGVMPMLTEGKDFGYKLRAEIPLEDSHTLRVGHEMHRFTLDDWWPAVSGNMMMGPNDYININNGERTRIGFYIESDKVWTDRWQTLVGVRYEHVTTDTDDVQPYNNMPGMMMMPNRDAAAAAAFNGIDHKRVDDNVDVTLSARYQMGDLQDSLYNTTFEFGYARKTRSPNLYERYSWGRNTMAMTMIGWFGDGNGYVGNVDLEAEIAHTLSATLTWQSRQPEDWLISVSPYYTYVDDYIGVDTVGSFNPRNVAAVTRPLFQFVNEDAELYGVEWSARKRLLEASDKGQLSLKADGAFTRGKNKTDSSDLYQIMPANLTVALEHQWQRWVNSLEMEWVASKHHVDEQRLENETASYTVINWDTRYQVAQVTLSLGVRNLLNKTYEEPLGGVYLSGWLAGDQTQQFAALPGQGRSVDIGVRYDF